jgi:hypothetical protein
MGAAYQGSRKIDYGLSVQEGLHISASMEYSGAISDASSHLIASTAHILLPSANTHISVCISKIKEER